MKVILRFKHLIPGSFLCIILLFFAGCSQKQGRLLNDILETIPVKDTAYWNSINTKYTEASAQGDDKTAAIFQQQIINFCKNNNYEAQLFHAFFASAQAMYKHNNISGGEKYTDSAAQIASRSEIRALKPQLNILLGQNPKLNGKDSALIYYKEALEDSIYLSDNYKDALFSGLCINYLHKGYYKEAKAYIPRLFELSKLDPNRIHRLEGHAALYQWLHLCDMELKDTVAAFNAINTAYHIIKDSLHGKADEGIYISLGDYYLNRQNLDSALFFYDEFDKSFNESEDVANRIIPKILKAEVYIERQNFAKARELLTAVEQIATPAEDDIGYFIIDYHEAKYKVNKHYGNLPATVKDLEETLTLTKQMHKDEKSQVLADLEESLAKARAEKTISQKEDLINKQQLYIFVFIVATILITLIGLLLFINQRRRKLLEQQRVKTLQQQVSIEKTQLRMQAEDAERKRISKEIHDDIGPALTTLNLAASMISQQIKLDEHKDIISLITKNTRSLSVQLNDVIWSLNSSNDNIESLVAFVRKFAGSFLQTANIHLIFTATISQNAFLEGYRRRNIFHSIKEILNNIVKHSRASQVKINIEEADNILQISIGDNGIGLPEDEKLTYGNGLNNIKNNIAAINGIVEWKKIDGLEIIISIPLNVI